MKKIYYSPRIVSLHLDQQALMMTVSNTQAVPGVDEEASKKGNLWHDDDRQIPSYNVWD